MRAEKRAPFIGERDDHEVEAELRVEDEVEQTDVHWHGHPSCRGATCAQKAKTRGQKRSPPKKKRGPSAKRTGVVLSIFHPVAPRGAIWRGCLANIHLLVLPGLEASLYTRV